MTKRVKDDRDYVKTESGAIVLDSKTKYSQHMSMMQAAKTKNDQIKTLETQVSELTDLVNKLLKNQSKKK